MVENYESKNQDQNLRIVELIKINESLEEKIQNGQIEGKNKQNAEAEKMEGEKNH